MIFVGCLYNPNDESELLSLSRTGLQNAANLYQWNIINGIETNIGVNVDIINVLPVGTYPNEYLKFRLPTRYWQHVPYAEDVEIGCVNLPIYKQLIRSLKIEKHLRRKLKGKKQSVLIYSPDYSLLRAIRRLPNDIKVVLIVTDLPEYYDLANTNIIRQLLRKLYVYIVYKYMRRVDAFVLLTEKMKEPLCINKRPYVVVEGLVNISERDNTLRNKADDKKIILYTGSLSEQFGIGKLLDAFELIENTNYELWICGYGEMHDRIVNRAKDNNRIRYFGYLSSNEASTLQKEATVLINPRENIGDYVSYSFPSKTMQYLLSGIPVICYKLGGIPDEYDPYLTYIQGNNPEDIRKSILEICELDWEIRNEIGSKGKEFIIKEKNNIKQTKKICLLINKLEMVD